MNKVYLLVVLSVVAASAKPGPRVIGGSDAGKLPYEISLQKKTNGGYQHTCGGAIISPTWVLTAAQCISDGSFRIVAGITNLDDNNSKRQEISVSKTVVHPNFGGGRSPNDIALVKLKSSLKFNDAVKAVSLPAAGYVAVGNSVLSGWGSVSGADNPVMPKKLQTVTVPILENSECYDSIDYLMGPDEENLYSEESNICTGPLDGSYGTCTGDYGDPLVQDGVVVGIGSWFYLPCASEMTPSIYTKVSNFLDFIEGKVTDLPK